MRSELHELLSRREELSEHEIDFTVQLCAELVQSHWAATHRAFEGVDENNLDHETVESLSDQNFKTVYEIQFIWQMGLWRIIALFDGIVAQRFPDLPGKGLQARLTRLESQGVIATADTSELRDWIRLRNVMSHRPVEGHSLSHQLELGDLQQVASVARRILIGASAPRAVAEAP